MRLLNTQSARRRGARSTLALVTVVAVTAAMSPTLGVASAGAAQPKKASASNKGEKITNYDARAQGASKVLALRSARMAAKAAPGVRTLQRSLGTQGMVEMDPLTGTPRLVGRIDGYLTKASNRSPVRIARGYVRAHPDVFKMSRVDVRALHLRKDYVDIAGTHHLSFVQSVGGVPVFGNGLRAHVSKTGRLIQIGGSPVAGLPSRLGAPAVSATGARSAAVADVFGASKATVKSQARTGSRQTVFRGGDRAKMVVFQTLSGPRVAWQVITMKEGYLHVIDAQTGRTLYRQNLVQSDNARVWENYPGAPRGGTQQVVSLSGNGWLPSGSPALRGNVAHVYMDVNDDNAAQATEEIPPRPNGNFTYPFTPFDVSACPTDWVCSWDPETPFSWQTNANQDSVQMFSFLGRFHDHLKAAPIGFTRSAGNFEAVDDDAVQGQSLDGANLVAGLPDGSHVDNANMLTPPDGMAPQMQMFLFHEPGTLFPTEDPFLAGNSGDEADVVYHEYTHGLSNRLVVDANGNSTLGDIQAGAMGEAWSDWYAMDFLVNQGLFRDRARAGDLRIGEYVGWGNDLIRKQPLDCPVGSTSELCPGTPGAGPGGYTYGDFGRVIGRPEVHADGEIWGETLWDLRKAIGSKLAESVVTRGMELAPSNPSYLDMRNAILQADLVVNGAQNQTAIWSVFAARGMGFFAGSVDGDDPAPAEDFSPPPPASTPRGTLTGTVTDVDSGEPAAGVTVVFGGHLNGFFGSYAAITDATGHYTIGGIIPGTYPKVAARGAGFDPQVQTVSIASRTQTLNWALRRDWAASSGGGRIVSFTPPDYTPFGCGPGGLIDQSQGTGWGSDAPTNPEVPNPQPKAAVIEMPATVDVAEIVVNPSNTCGDAGSASTGDYRVETSTDGTTWTVANQGHFGVADRRPTSIPLAPASTDGVKFVRYTMIGTQVADTPGGTCPGPFDGCDFMDSTELAVYGTQSE